MATAHDIARTVDDLVHELADRIDELLKEKRIDHHAAVSLGGIVEWAASIRDALDHCTGVPTPSVAERVAATQDRVRVKLTLAQARQVDSVMKLLDPYWCAAAVAAERGEQPKPRHALPVVGNHGGCKTSKLLHLSPDAAINADLVARLTGQRSSAGTNLANRIRHACPELKKR